MTRVLPDNSWEIYLETVYKATETINEILDGQPIGPLLNQFLYILFLQQGVCVARWVLNNKELVTKLNKIQSFTKEEFDQISLEVKASVEKLVKT